MVTIVDSRSMENLEGETFFGLVVQGGIEAVKSAQSGRMYFTSRKATVPTTFNEVMCKSLVGTTMKGSIKKVECDPFDYTIAETGEVIQLEHRYEYVTEDSEIISSHVQSEEVY